MTIENLNKELKTTKANENNNYCNSSKNNDSFESYTKALHADIEKITH